MTFSNADIEDALRHLFHHDIHRTARGHGRRHTDNAWVLFRQFQERLAEDLTIFQRLLRRALCNTLSRGDVKLPGACHTVASFSAGA